MLSARWGKTVGLGFFGAGNTCPQTGTSDDVRWRESSGVAPPARRTVSRVLAAGLRGTTRGWWPVSKISPPCTTKITSAPRWTGRAGARSAIVVSSPSPPRQGGLARCARKGKKNKNGLFLVFVVLSAALAFVRGWSTGRSSVENSPIDSRPAASLPR